MSHDTSRLTADDLERGLHDLLNRQGGSPAQPAGQGQDPFDGAWHEESLGGGALRVRLVDEGGKININRVNEDTLRRIFTNLGLDGVRRDTLVDSILDWRDEDDLHRANGAESEYYRALDAPYTARNGPLDTVADLLWIRGRASASARILVRRRAERLRPHAARCESRRNGLPLPRRSPMGW